MAQIHHKGCCTNVKVITYIYRHVKTLENNTEYQCDEDLVMEVHGGEVV
jgi:hypothetical protein